MMDKISFTSALSDFHLIVLNQKFDKDFPSFWNSANLKIVADGAANLLYSHDPKLVPNYIIGDFDSISEKVLKFYNNKCNVLRIRDQDSTDFQKCIDKIIDIESLDDNLNVKSSAAIFAIGALSGRLDHTISCLHTLLKYPDKRIFLISADSIATLVRPGKSEIYCHKDYEGHTCGLFPLTGTALVETTGLKWNLGKPRSYLDHTMPMNFGSLVSTSNVLGEDGFDSQTGLFKVTVSTDIPLIFTVERKSTSLTEPIAQYKS